MVPLASDQRALVLAAPKRLRPAERRGAAWLPRYAGTWLLGLFAGLVLIAGIVQGGHGAKIAEAAASSHHALARVIGFGVERITLSGLAELTEDELITTGSIDPRAGLPFLDADAIRGRIAAMPLVETVSVRKLYPADLVISVSERKPYALWQLDGDVALVSKDGVIIDRTIDARFAHLPLAVGRGANLRVSELTALLEAAGDLRGRIRAGTLVSERRWNLKLTNGIDVRLPEDDPVRAVKRLVELQRRHKIMDRAVLTIDLRDPLRVTLRLTTEAADARREALRAKLGKWKGGNT